MLIPRRLFAARSTVPSRRILPRTIYGSCVARRQLNPPNSVSHSAENYFVDSDDTLPPGTLIYKVDASSDAVESAYEPPSGPWSRAGTEEYQTVNKDEPYGVTNSPDVELRYGGRRKYVEDKAPETGEAREDPEGTGRRGRNEA